ncbi:MAG: M3 family metallopeptidase, partial [Rickettsiales bacterium]|nr:M3 family metallopeptidase [Rickettsiales bacterium]
GEKQGVLQAGAPMAYAETASIFGEMLAFEYMLARTEGKKEKLALLLAKSADWLNSVNRQISFSLFEQEVHGRRKGGKLTTAEFCRAWLGVTVRMYGRDGDVFEYSDMENLWSYVGHFMRPFYVYAYSFGELFTQSLFAGRASIGPKFERLYIEMLESGGTRDAKALMKPFGLDPTDARFWKSGVDVSIRRWLDEAEALMRELGL